MLYRSNTTYWNYKKNTEQITDLETAPCNTDKFYSNWAQYSGNSRFDLKTEINFELQKLYMRGKGRKIKKGELL